VIWVPQADLRAAIRQAQESGSTLKDYAAKFGLDVRKLCELRRRVVRKGAFGAPPPRKTRRRGQAFARVRVVPAATVPNGGPVTCRPVHPSGWVLECDRLPPAAWMASVLVGDAYATA
jgi:hypothetical protein